MSRSVFVTVLLLASIGLNLLFLSGCIGIDKPWSVSNKNTYNARSNDRAALESIARTVGVTVRPGQDAESLRSSIINKLDPEIYRGDVLDEKSLEDVEAGTRSETFATVKEMNVFLREIKGKRIIILDPL